MHDDDVVCGKLYALIGAGDDRVIPFSYLAEENAGQGVRGEIQSRVDTGNVVAGNRRAVDRERDRKSTRLNSSHQIISYAVFCLKKKKKHNSTREWDI